MIKCFLFVTGDAHRQRLRDEDDELLQFAIQQSLMESGTEADQVRQHINPLYLGNPLMSTFANSEDPDEMQHNAAFH